MTKSHFISFANNGYMNTERIFNEAQDSGFFETISIKNENNISDFINKHRKFIKKNKDGYGRFIWKPKIIFDALNTINEGEFLVYSDAGSHINKNGKKTFEEYLNRMSDEKPIGIFSTSDNYTIKEYVKRDIIMHYYPEFDTQENVTYAYAGIIIIKKNNFSLKFIEEYKNLVENYSFLDNSMSKNYKESDIYIGNDGDNGIFCLCVMKHKNNVVFLGQNEIMIYKNGIQYHHLDVDEQTELNWNVLHDKPFQARRLRPTSL